METYRGEIFERTKFGKTNIGSVNIWSFSLNSSLTKMYKSVFGLFFSARSAEDVFGNENRINSTKKGINSKKIGKTSVEILRKWVKIGRFFLTDFVTKNVPLHCFLPPPFTVVRCLLLRVLYATSGAKCDIASEHDFFENSLITTA